MQKSFSSLNKTELYELLCYLENYQIKKRETIGLPKSISFGTELEFGNVTLSEVETRFAKIIPTWRIYQDNSVIEFKDGKYLGAEIATSILHDTKEDWQLLEFVINKLKEMQAYITPKCSNHIHIGGQIFREELKNVIHFVKLWCIFEDIIYRFGSGPSKLRPGVATFARPIREGYIKLLLNNKKHFEEIITTKYFDFGSTRSINFHNLRYLSSEEEVGIDVEVRTPNGSLDYNIVQNNINFFTKLMMYASSEEYEEKIVDRLFTSMLSHPLDSLKEAQNISLSRALFLCDLIFDNTLDKLNFLRQYVKEEDLVRKRELTL